MVSVIITTYNRAAYVVEAVRSVLAQTFADFEVVVVDDGSTDETPQALSAYGGRIRVVRQANAERAVARNRGVGESRGGLLAFLDSDDTWLPAKLARQVEVFGRHADVGLVGCACNYVDAGGRFLRAFVRAGLDGVVPGALTAMLQANLFGTPSAVMMRRSLFDALGGFNEDRRLLCVEDYELWCRAAHRGPIYYLPEALVNYREHAGNAPRAPMRFKYAAMAESLLRHLALGVEQRREARQVIGQRLLDNAWDSLGEREFRVARQCVVAAAGVAPRLLFRPAFYKMLARSLLRV